jgi:hypothetical protein
VAAVAAASAVAGPASAKTCTKRVAPPGHAGSTQYYETVPTSCGNATPPGAGGSGSTTSSSPINRLGQGHSGVKTLSRLGSQGGAAAALAAATAPNPTGTGAEGSGTSGSASAPPASASSAGANRGLSVPSTTGSAGSALTSALTGSGSGGLGVLLPIFLGLSLVAAIGVGVFRARRAAGRPV